MDVVFETDDKIGRRVYMSQERWRHINQEHPEVIPYVEEIKEVIKNPTHVYAYVYDVSVRYYYKDLKQRRPRYLLVIVKYLNEYGFIITAYFTKHIKWKEK